MSHEKISPLGAQSKLSQKLTIGFVLTFIPLFGFVSLIIGTGALRQINQSSQELVGRKMAWWCIVVGGIGAAISLVAAIRFFGNSA